MLFFASPFFEAALSGNWSETGRPQSISSVITISQPPSDPAQKVAHESPPELTFAPIDSFDSEIEDLDVVTDTDSSRVKDDVLASDPDATKVINRVTSLAKLEGQTSPPPRDPPELYKSASEEILSKKMAPGVNISLPRDVNPRTKDGLMKIVGVEYQNAQIDAKWMNVVGWNRRSVNNASVLTQTQSDAGGLSLRNWFGKFTGSNTGNSITKRAQKEEDAMQQAMVDFFSQHRSDAGAGLELLPGVLELLRALQVPTLAGLQGPLHATCC